MRTADPQRCVPTDPIDSQPVQLFKRQYRPRQLDGTRRIKICLGINGVGMADKMGAVLRIAVDLRVENLHFVPIAGREYRAAHGIGAQELFYQLAPIPSDGAWTDH